MHGKQVRFFSTVEVVNALALEKKAQNKTGQLNIYQRIGSALQRDPEGSAVLLNQQTKSLSAPH